MPYKRKQVVIEKDVYDELIKVRNEEGRQIQWQVNNLLRETLGLPKKE